MKTKLYLLMVIFFSVLCGYNVQAQQVRGKVYNDSREILSGVTVQVKGTNISTTTGQDGGFVLDNVAQGSVLLFSYLGYQSVAHRVGDNTPIEIILEVGTNSLDEVVVVGYGTQRRQDVTGAIASVDSKVLKEIPAANMTQALQGRIAGVNISHPWFAVIIGRK
jgi:hypothetical protein